MHGLTVLDEAWREVFWLGWPAAHVLVGGRVAAELDVVTPVAGLAAVVGGRRKRLLMS
jgi:hypothetical protein